MTLESIYYIGQTVAVLAILISLISLISTFFQMRQGQAVERVTAQRELMKQSRDLVEKLGEDEALYNNVRQCMSEYSTGDGKKKAKRSRR